MAKEFMRLNEIHLPQHVKNVVSYVVIWLTLLLGQTAT